MIMNSTDIKENTWSSFCSIINSMDFMHSIDIRSGTLSYLAWLWTVLKLEQQETGDWTVNLFKVLQVKPLNRVIPVMLKFVDQLVL